MYMFSRTARLGPGNIRDQLAWSVDITEKVNQISELEVSCWSTVFSPGLNTLVWTATVEELAVLEATDAKLIADNGYIALMDVGQKFASGDAIDDRIVQLVLADTDAANTRPSYANVVVSALADGAFVRGVEVGVEIAQRAKKITGAPVSFGVASTGVYGGVMWASTFDSVDQLQKADQALAADTSLAKFLDKDAKGLFQESQTTQTAYRRLA
jgi:hypothetical protein